MRRFLVELEPLLLRLGLERRQLLAPRLDAALAVGQNLGGHTILSNETRVHRGQGGQVAKLDRLVHRVVAGEHDGQDPALGLQLVERAETPAEDVLLPGAAGLEPADLALQIRDVGLRATHAPVDRDHLLALLGEPLVDRLQLAQHARLALARVGRLQPLFPELLLGLLQVALLVADVGRALALGHLGPGGRGSEQGGRHREGQREPPGAGHACARPRASRPPIAPSMVPAPMRASACSGERKVTRSRPMVTGSSGSRRGTATA